MKTLSTALLLTGLLSSLGLAGCQTVEYEESYDTGYRRPSSRVVYEEDVYVRRAPDRWGYDRPRRWSEPGWGAPPPPRPVYQAPRPVYAPPRPAYAPPPVYAPRPTHAAPPVYAPPPVHAAPVRPPVAQPMPPMAVPSMAPSRAPASNQVGVRRNPWEQ